ncbi:DNA-directed RNA polymerases I, II, and III subunit RPABC3 [Nematocida homosporus]|uniref:DNA-directed RNA polymerases I, II, and III subunit RPABC3 n=1 Tax=Nematocida homosporus TaxID=1912981 RepID=UPI00221ED29A|nr:DNA-directed RNA polymerases I, II, and III subunit RPABC3 [Nematocida homosporus]KAI5185781.1 DNA-directed RNA polymerases I, II, and III subunit RPABC3 [Nematocida homosporus]
MKILADVCSLVEIDPKGKMFDDVSRGILKSDQTTFHIDFHTGLLKCKKMDKLEIAIFSNDNKFNESNIPDKYNYLMGNGVVYKRDIKDGVYVVDMSFSGLLVQISQSTPITKELEEEKRFYLGIAAL